MGSATSSADHLILCNYAPSFDHFKGTNHGKQKLFIRAEGES